MPSHLSTLQLPAPKAGRRLGGGRVAQRIRLFVTVFSSVASDKKGSNEENMLS